MAIPTNINISIVYATFNQQRIIPLEVPRGITLHQAIQLSGILNIFPEINLLEQKIGIFGKLKSLEDFAQNGDRIEIYRPLLIDPKEARRKRESKK